MAQISYVKYSEFKDARRIDSEFFRPEYIESNRIIQKNDWVYFDSDTADITGGNAFKSEGFGFGKTKVAKITDLSQEKDVDQWDTISDGEIDSFPKKFLKRNDILFSGTHHNYKDIGKVILIDFETFNTTFNQRVFRIRFKEKINQYYGYVLLKSRYLRDQIEKFGRGNNQLNLNYSELNQFKIPILPQPFQLQIEQDVKLALQKNFLSKQLYYEAETLLLRELDLLNYVVENNSIFAISNAKIKFAKRFDSEYFQPKYEKIIKKIEKYEGGSEFAGDIVKWKKGVEVGTEAYTETGIDFIRVSDFSKYGITESSKKISKETFEVLRKSFQPKQGEILFTKDGTIGISYVLKENIEGILSGAFLRLSLKEKHQNFEKECLSLIFSSILCKMQVEKLSGGAIIAHLKPSDFETFKIPLIKSSIQKQIAEKIQESYKLRKESKDLLDETKRKVEEEIEKE